nr:hypothetical protein [Tanacetum cinerariifolium]
MIVILYSLNSNAHQLSQSSNSPEKNMLKRVNIKLWWRGGDEGDDGVGGSVVGVAFGGGGINEVVVVTIMWRVGDDVGGGSRLLDWPEVARDGRWSSKIVREKGG